MLGKKVGDIIDFDGMVHEPINEQGVIFLFAKIHNLLMFRVDHLNPAGDFPDAIVRDNRDMALKSLEFEYTSSDYNKHHHPVEGCDIIVCWIHNWSECPKNIRVIELKTELKSIKETGKPAFAWLTAQEKAWITMKEKSDD